MPQTTATATAETAVLRQGNPEPAVSPKSGDRLAVPAVKCRRPGMAATNPVCASEAGSDTMPAPPQEPAIMSEPTASALPAAGVPWHPALQDASLIIASFRRRLREAGYPFAEPPGVAEILTRIDALCFSTEAKVKEGARKKTQRLQIPVFPTM